MKRPRGGGVAAQVDRLDMRHVLTAEARRQRHALVAALARIDLGLDRWRGRRQHDRDLCDMRAHHRHVAGMIVRAVVLLVGLVVLFIDDDQAEIGIGQKQRRARADHDRRLAGRDRRPVARAGARRQFGMPFQRTHAKTLREAIEKLAGQRDLRHQDQRLLAAADRFGNRLEIDFSLARAGDAVEQSDMKMPLAASARMASTAARCWGENSGCARSRIRRAAAAAAAASLPPRACLRRPGRRSRRC